MYYAQKTVFQRCTTVLASNFCTPGRTWQLCTCRMFGRTFRRPRSSAQSQLDFQLEFRFRMASLYLLLYLLVVYLSVGHFDLVQWLENVSVAMVHGEAFWLSYSLLFYPLVMELLQKPPACVESFGSVNHSWQQGSMASSILYSQVMDPSELIPKFLIVYFIIHLRNRIMFLDVSHAY